MLMTLLSVLFASLLAAPAVSLDGAPETDGSENNYKFRKLDSGLGLPHSDVNAVIQDSDGFIWIASYGGLCRYDGYRLRTFRSDNSGLSRDRVLSLWESPDRRIYIGTESGGLNVYDPEKREIQQVVFGGDGEESIFCIFGDGNSNVFAGCNSALVQVSTSSGDSLVRRWTNPYGGVIRTGLSLSENHLLLGSANGVWSYDLGTGEARMVYEGGVWCMKNDSDRILVGTVNGLCAMDVSTFAITPLISGLSVRSIERDFHKHYWIGTFNNGLFELGPTFEPIGHYIPDTQAGGHLSSAQVETLCLDGSGILWIGTNGGGLNSIDLKGNNIRLYNTACGLTRNRVMTFCEDSHRGVWVASQGGGIDILNREDNKFSHLSINGKESEDFPMILSLNTSPSGDIYVGTMEYGLWIVSKSQVDRMWHEISQGRKPSVIAVKSDITDNCSVFKVVHAPSGEMWISTNAGVLELVSGKVRRFGHDNYNQMSLWSDFVTDIYPDPSKDENCVWVGTRLGLNKIVFREGESEPSVYRVSLNADELHIHKFVSSVRRDSRGVLWITTLGDGLFCYRNGAFVNYTAVSTGFANNELECMEMDSDGRLWIAGFGIGCFNPDTESVRRYSEKDNLQSNSFKMWASLKLSDGNMVFGGTDGFNIFHPDSIRIDTFCPRPVLSRLMLGGKSVTDGAECPYTDNSLVVEFALPNYRHTESNSFVYRLDGFDKDWNHVSGETPKCSYANLTPGRYVFELYASNADGVECPEMVSASFVIRPPFWRSGIAYAVYFLAAVLAVYGLWLLVRRQMRQRERHIMQEHKLMTFTDMAHEIRTPLSLISAPVEELLANPAIGTSTRSRLEVVERSVKSLKSVVDQVLDLRKYEDNMMSLKVVKVNMCNFLAEAAELFVPLARSRGIMFRIDIPEEPVEAYIDKYKMERVIVNLLSNAFKFTPEGGAVCLSCGEDDAYVTFSVQDNGQGISEKDQAHIFERFYQGNNKTSENDTGMGIGLSLSKYIVAHHKGEISVESRLGFGSKFSVRLLKGCSQFSESQINHDYRNSNDLSNYEPVQSFKDICSTYAGEKSATVLVADDNDDLRRYLYELLSLRYNVLTAGDGLSAYELAIAKQPDLVLSDIMMPKMSGIELCRHIKSNETTKNIIVVLLTARNVVSTEVESYKTGADAFITKPFSTELLLTRVQTLIENRDNARKAFGGVIEVNPSDVAVVSQEEQLVRKCLELVEENIDDSDFGVDELCHAVGMSRPQLYRRLQAATGESPIAFIRSIRLKRAAQILAEDSSSVSSVMFQVGFNSLSYFSKLFKAQYGCQPKEYAGKHGKKG